MSQEHASPAVLSTMPRRLLLIPRVNQFDGLARPADSPPAPLMYQGPNPPGLVAVVNHTKVRYAKKVNSRTYRIKPV